MPIVDTIFFLGIRGYNYGDIETTQLIFLPLGHILLFPDLVTLLNYSTTAYVGEIFWKIINHSKNASYFSQQVQNEIIECCGELISETIVKRVKDANFFSILADEAIDASKQEQLALVLRYVHQNAIY